MKKTDNILLLLVGHIKYFLRKSKSNNISALSGRSAFFLILSVIPFFMFIITIVALFSGSTPEISRPENVVKGGLNDLLYALMEYLIGSVQSSSGLIIITVVVALWSSGKGLYTITDGISQIYGLPNKRIWLINRIAAMGYTLVVILLIIIGLVLLMIDGFVMYMLSFAINSFFISTLINIFQKLFLNFLLLILLTLALRLYLKKRVSDKRLITFRALLPGMTLVVITWNLLTIGVNIYILFFASSSIYGSLGTAVIIMMGVYFMIYIFLYGVQFNHLYRCRLLSLYEKRKQKRLRKNGNASAAADNNPPENNT